MTNSLTIQLTVTANQGSPRLSLEIDDEMTSSDLLKRISETTNIPLSNLKVIYRGKLISNKKNNKSESVVQEFQLEQDSVLHCIGKPATNTSATASTSTNAPSNTTSNSIQTAVNASVPSVASINTATSTSTNATNTNDSPLNNAIQSLRSHNSPNDYQTALSTMDKLLQNIIQNPMEAKYRTIKKLNPAVQKRLSGKQGGHQLILACGFVETTDTTSGNNEVVYQMEPSPEAWPTLLQTKQDIQKAAMAASTSAATAPPAASNSGLPVPNLNNTNLFSNGVPPDMNSPQLQQAAQQLLSNPQQLQAMLQVMFVCIVLL